MSDVHDRQIPSKLILVQDESSPQSSLIAHACTDS
jgi:hypothetical protein